MLCYVCGTAIALLWGVGVRDGESRGTRPRRSGAGGVRDEASTMPLAGLYMEHYV